MDVLSDDVDVSDDGYDDDDDGGFGRRQRGHHHRAPPPNGNDRARDESPYYVGGQGDSDDDYADGGLGIVPRGPDGQVLMGPEPLSPSPPPDEEADAAAAAVDDAMEDDDADDDDDALDGGGAGGDEGAGDGDGVAGDGARPDAAVLARWRRRERLHRLRMQAAARRGPGAAADTEAATGAVQRRGGESKLRPCLSGCVCWCHGENATGERRTISNPGVSTLQENARS